MAKPFNDEIAALEFKRSIVEKKMKEWEVGHNETLRLIEDRYVDKVSQASKEAEEKRARYAEAWQKLPSACKS